MGKKKKGVKHSSAAPPTITAPVSTATPRWILPTILLLAVIAFIPALKAGFVNWDDDDYVVKNLLLNDGSHLGKLLFTPIQGNYHPLTMLSLAINHAISGEDAWSYHLFNLVFHLINCVLVFRLAMLLSKKNITIAFTTAILFAIHPLHVESVAWVSERKDVLYALFFLLGLIAYIRYVDTGKKKSYLLCLLFLVFSLLSKPAAVIFPVALFCLDLLRQRKWDIKLFVEKIPFFIPAIAMGVLTFMAQKQVGATEGEQVFHTGTRLLFACYGIMMYIVKMILPVNLSPFYPLPALNQSLPVAYYVSPFFVLLLAVLVFYSLKKNKVIAFGILFYLVNLLLVLQFLSAGSAIIADRYTYIPYIGLFYILGWLVSRYTHQNLSKASYFIIPVSLVLTMLSYQQSGVWYSSETLWDHAISNQPSSRAYDNRATLLRRDGDLEKAIQYYNESIRLNAIDHEAYTNRGNVYLDQNKLDLAYLDYRKALELKPDYYIVMDNLGALFGMRGKFDSALLYLNRALTLKPDYHPAYRNRAFVYSQMQKNTEAIKDFESYLQYQPGDPDVYNSIGACYQALGKYSLSLSFIDKAIDARPDPHFFLNRSYCYYAMKNSEQAKKDALVAKQAGLPIDPAYAQTLGIR